MSEKHYNAEYLENTGKLLARLKQFSYQPFLAIKNIPIIDLGCGTGKDAFNLAQLIGAEASIIGVDHDEKMLDIARKEHHAPNIQYLSSQSDKLPFEDNSIGGLRAERLIQHLVEPRKTFLEAKRILKPGSPLVIVESDWNSLTFYTGNVEIEEKIIRFLTQTKVNHGLAAKYLSTYFMEIGLQQIRLEMFNFTLHTMQEANEYLWLNYILKDACDQHHITSQEYETFLKSLEIAEKNGCFVCSMNILVATGIC